MLLVAAGADPILVPNRPDIASSRGAFDGGVLGRTGGIAAVILARGGGVCVLHVTVFPSMDEDVPGRPVKVTFWPSERSSNSITFSSNRGGLLFLRSRRRSRGIGCGAGYLRRRLGPGPCPKPAEEDPAECVRLKPVARCAVEPNITESRPLAVVTVPGIEKTDIAGERGCGATWFPSGMCM